jgi:membrane-bound lytic murein transglycosylase D
VVPDVAAARLDRALRFRDVQDAYRAGMDAYNQQNFAEAEVAFSRGLDLLDASPPTDGTADQDVRRHDLLRTKLSYFHRQSRDRLSAAEALAQEIQDQEIAQGTPVSDYPLEMNPRVLKCIDAFQNKMHERFQLYINRSGRWRPMMTEILQEHGVPLDLFYLSMIESGYSPKAYSRAHASGLWQFIKGTGKLYGLRMDQWVDERRDPIKSTHAGARHLRDLYQSLGDWNLALAAYNCGEARVRRAMKKAGTNDYWMLDLPKQTEDYVPTFMAAAHIMSDPERYGFRAEYDPPLETESVTLNRSYTLSRLASVSGTSVEHLRELNPSLRKDATPPYRDGYDIHLPVGHRERLLAQLDVISREPEPLPEPETTVASSGGVYKVRRGDTLSKIAARHGTTPDAIARANGIRKTSVIHTGQRLRLPGDGSASASSARADASSRGEREVAAGAEVLYTVRRGDTVGEIARRHGVSPNDVLRRNKLGARSRIYPGQELRIGKTGGSGTSKSSASSGTVKTYTVRAGDTLWKIARRFGTSVTDILTLNKLREDAVLYPGDRIKVLARG